MNKSLINKKKKKSNETVKSIIKNQAKIVDNVKDNVKDKDNIKNNVKDKDKDNVKDNKKNIKDDKLLFEKEFQEIRNTKNIHTSSEWYKNEYMKQWEFNKMNNIHKMQINGTDGSVLRMNNITNMKYNFIYNTMDMIIVVMKLYDYNLKKETNYGTLFCELYDTMIPIRRASLYNDTIFGNVAFTFYSASPSFISCDGEYRSKFSRYQSLIKAKEEFIDIWNELEEYMNYIKIRRQLSVYTSYFYPKLEQENRGTEVEYAVKNNMMPLVILITSWFNAIYDEMLNITPININEVYKNIMLSNKETDVEFLKELIKKHGVDKIEKFKAKISHTVVSFKNILGTKEERKSFSYMQCGYKMIPLNFKEVQDPMKLRYKPWREYYISAKCNDLVVNSIAPNFSIILDWFYIKNSRKGLYDNKSQYDRMKNSELAKDILHILYEAQRGTYFAAENLQHMNKTSGQIKQWISNKFKRLSEKIDDPINYSIEQIIMSEVTLAFSSEFVGRTFADTVAIVQQSKVYDQYLGHPFKEIGYDYFAKYIFEICYGLFCVNSLLGVIHGDFHLNNATIGALYYPDKEVMLNKNKKNKVVYVIDSESQYVFPNNCYFSNIIDFSRGIIDPSKHEIFNDESFQTMNKLVVDEEQFHATELETLLNLYIQLFPTKKKQREELVVLFKNHFNAVFRLLTCIDLYMFSSRLSKAIQLMNIPYYKKTLELVNRINQLSEVYITTDMNHLLNDPIMYGNKILENDYPICEIIKKCFSEYNDGKIYKTPSVITDVYIYNNPMKYSISKYSTFPDILKYVKYYDDKKNIIDVPKVADVRKLTRTEYEKQKLYNLEMVSYIAMRHTQKTV